MKYMTKRQFATALGVSIRTVERKVNAGAVKLGGRTVGGHWRFTRDELERCRNTTGLFRGYEKQRPPAPKPVSIWGAFALLSKEKAP